MKYSENKTIDDKGRIVISKGIRDLLGLHPGSIVSVTMNEDNSLTVRSVKICDNCKDTSSITEAVRALEQIVKSLQTDGGVA